MSLPHSIPADPTIPPSIWLRAAFSSSQSFPDAKISQNPIWPPLTQSHTLIPVWRARFAIIPACEILGLSPGSSVWISAYHCGSETNALRAAGLDLHFHDVPDLASSPTPSFPLPDHHVDAIYLIHPPGLPLPTSAARAWCDAHHAALIEDASCLHPESFSTTTAGSLADATLLSPRKFLASHHGGLLAIRPPHPIPILPPPSTPPPYNTLARECLHSLRARIPRPPIKSLHFNRCFFSKHQIPPSPDPFLLPPHPAFLRLCAEHDWREDAASRRSHYQFLSDHFPSSPHCQPALPTPPAHHAPLHFPILCNDRDSLMHHFHRHHIPALPWWPGPDPPNPELFPTAHHLRHHILTLPIHPQLSLNQLKTILQALI